MGRPATAATAAAPGPTIAGSCEPPAREEAELGVGVDEGGARGAQEDVAREGDLEPSVDGDAVDGADDGHAAPRSQQLHLVHDVVREVGRVHLEHPVGVAEVDAGGEGAAAGARDDDRADARVLPQRAKRRGERHERLARDGVQSFGGVEDDHRDALVRTLDANGHRDRTTRNANDAPRTRTPPRRALDARVRQPDDRTRRAEKRRADDTFDESAGAVHCWDDEQTHFYVLCTIRAAVAPRSPRRSQAQASPRRRLPDRPPLPRSRAVTATRPPCRRGSTSSAPSRCPFRTSPSPRRPACPS